MKKVLIIAALLVATLPFMSVGCSANSGKQATQQYQYSNFSNVQVGGAFEVEIIPSDEYSVEVTAGENILERVKIEQTGSTLVIDIEPDRFFWNWGHSRPQAIITMPEIAVLDVSGASKVTANSFSSTKNFNLNLSGASTADIDIEAYDASIVLTGASKVSGKYAGHDVRLNVSRASTAQLQGAGNNINLQASEASMADLSSLIFNDARVDLNRASRAQVLNSGKLDVFLSGGSKLQYGGNPEMGTVEVSGGSTISHS